MPEEELRQEAEHRLGTSIENCEWADAKDYAERKLKNIIQRFGDEGGARRELWYLAQLIAETVQQQRFQWLTIGMMMEYQELANMEAKKEQPVS